MANKHPKLKLGKGTLFVKSQMKRLPQQDDIWEADFRALPNPMDETETHYLGLVVSIEGSLLAHHSVPYTPDVNDLATLLGEAIRRPPVGGAHRPDLIHLRGNPRWEELFPHLKEIGIEVAIENELPNVEDCYRGVLRQIDFRATAPIIQLTREQTDVAKGFPAIDEWVQGWGWIEIGEQESQGFVAQALDEGGLVYEASGVSTLAQAMATLEEALKRFIEENRAS